MGNYIENLFWKHSPERMQTYKDGYEAGQKDSIEILKKALKDIKDLEAFRTYTATTSLSNPQ